jgi:hypothetical protein
MSTIKEQLETLKELRIQEILEYDISKLDKLKLFAEERLFGIADKIQNEFSRWEEEEKSIIMGLGYDGSKEWNKEIIFKNLLMYESRYVTLYYPDRLQEIKNSYFDTEYLVSVLLFHRGHFQHYVDKTYEEVENELFDFCVKNRLIGFIYNW